MELVLHCPHCDSERMGFNFAGVWPPSKGIPTTVLGHAHKTWHTLFICRHCREGVVVKFTNSNIRSTQDLLESINPVHRGYQISAIHPEPKRIEAPNHVPDGIAQDYREAADGLRRQSFTSAGMMFRKVLEQATLELAPASDRSALRKQRLNDRIDTLAGQHLLTPAMRDWAHMIRLEGNEAAHEEEQFTQEKATQMQEFTELFLLYAFTLPSRVAGARQKDDGNEPSDSP